MSTERQAIVEPETLRAANTTTREVADVAMVEAYYQAHKAASAEKDARRS
jgi:prophage DNA circulation protein